MEIYINGKLAALKSGTSFDFVAENRAFTGSDSYTMNIVFPLAGCAQNLQIFGHINRKDVDESSVSFDCDIRDRQFFRSGMVTITELSETEVKCQFLEGRSAQNFNTAFDEIYINELDLGGPKDTLAEKYVYHTTAEECLKSIDQGRNYVALPFVNNSSGNMLNKMYCQQSTGKMRFTYQDYVGGINIPAEDSNNGCISWMPYLIFITKKVCEVLGYQCDFSQWETSKQRFLLICNTLPAVWMESGFKRDWKTVLPHWTVSEFFKQLEYLLWGEFDIDHKAKSISFGFIQTNNARIPSLYIDKVVDEFTSELTEDDESEYIDNYDLEYKDNGSTRWKLLTCDWYLKEMGHKAQSFKTMQQLVSFVEKYKVIKGYDEATKLYSYGIDEDEIMCGLFYVEENDTYFILYNYKAIYNRRYYNRNYYDRYFKLMQVGIFSPKRYVSDNENSIELGIVPAWIDETDDTYGEMLFLSCGDLGETNLPNIWSQWSVTMADDINNFAEGILNGAIVQNQAARAMNEGEPDKAHEFFSNIYVAYWDNVSGKRSTELKAPCPVIDSIYIADNNIFSRTPYSLRLNDGQHIANKGVKIEGRRKYTFKWLSDTVPNARAIFNIKGKRYVCKKITATFTEKGMSQLLKGEFYRLQE